MLNIRKKKNVLVMEKCDRVAMMIANNEIGNIYSFFREYSIMILRIIKMMAIYDDNNDDCLLIVYDCSNKEYLKYLVAIKFQAILLH